MWYGIQHIACAEEFRHFHLVISIPNQAICTNGAREHATVMENFRREPALLAVTWAPGRLCMQPLQILSAYGDRR